MQHQFELQDLATTLLGIEEGMGSSRRPLPNAGGLVVLSEQDLAAVTGALTNLLVAVKELAATPNGTDTHLGRFGRQSGALRSIPASWVCC